MPNSNLNNSDFSPRRDFYGLQVILIQITMNSRSKQACLHNEFHSKQGKKTTNENQYRTRKKTRNRLHNIRQRCSPSSWTFWLAVSSPSSPSPPFLLIAPTSGRPQTNQQKTKRELDENPTERRKKEIEWFEIGAKRLKLTLKVEFVLLFPLSQVVLLRHLARSVARRLTEPYKPQQGRHKRRPD